MVSEKQTRIRRAIMMTKMKLERVSNPNKLESATIG